jgi:hypothetical protein
MKQFLIALVVGVVITAGFEALSEFAKQPDQSPAPPQRVNLPIDSQEHGY